MAWGISGNRAEQFRYNGSTPMISGRNACELASLAVVCVVLIFLFPAGQGPYSVVNGPVTALQAARAAVRLLKSMAQGALSAAFKFLLTAACLLRIALPREESECGALPECTILRC